MFNRTAVRGASPISIFTQHKDTNKTPQMRKEVGTWLYHKETMQEFQQWCKTRHVRAYNNIRITSAPHYARCLRATKKVYPGQGIITLPLSSAYSFMNVAKEMYDYTNNFPLQITWMNYDERVPYLKGSSFAELTMAGWMGRVASTEESGFTPFVKWLLEDTRGRDGIANGISKERGDDGSMLDHILSEMATDSCEEPEAFLENIFRSYSAIFNRTVPLEPDAVEYAMTGTTFFKARKNDIFVPALMPLIDCVPQREDGLHNTLVEYYPDSKLTNTNKIQLMKELDLEDLDAPSGMGGLLVLRAINAIEEGDYYTLRSWPKTAHADSEIISSNIIEAARLMNNTDVGI